jgi:uncharacterized delta-60 repeat protein
MHVLPWLRRWADRLTRARIQRIPQRLSSRLRLEALEDRLTPSTGGLLDPTFGSGGHVLSPLAGGTDVYAVTLQPDGKIVVGGVTSAPGGAFIVGRYNADGSLDTSFGSGGYNNTTFDSVWALAMQPQPDGTSKILAAGKVTVTQKHGKTVTSTVEIALARYNANGTLDTTFGTNGKVTTIPAGQSEYAMSMAVDTSGRIVVAAGTDWGMATLVRYTPNGALDTSFGTGGAHVTNIPVFANQESIALQPDGKIVLAVTSPDQAPNSPGVITARFNVNGTADSTFGSSGVVTNEGVGGVWGRVAIQGDGKIVVAELDPSGYCLLRYNPDGTLDAGFGSGGEVNLNYPYGWEFKTSHLAGVAVQTDGKIVAGGDLYDPVLQQSHFVAVRVSTTGALDTGYGNSGWASTQFGNGDTSFAMALQPDGRLLFAGWASPSTSNTTNEVALVRFLGSAPQVGSFTASPDPATAGSLATLTVSGITDGNPSSTITQVTCYYIDGTGTKQVLGYGTSDGQGNWALSFTVNLAPGTYTLYVQAQDSYGALGDPFALQLTVAALTPNGGGGISGPGPA